MKNKALVLAFAAAAVVAFGVPAMAGTFTSTDGSLSVELPNDNWKTFDNSNNWISLSDGNSVLTIDRYTVGDVLPAPITGADDPYVETFQTVFSNKTNVYLFTGSVKDEAKLKDITDIILSANVMKPNTAPAAAKDSKAEDGKKVATPTPQPDKTAPATTLTVYDEFGNSFTITSSADGRWYDGDGTAYTRLSATDFQVYEGMKRVFTYDPTANDGMVPEENYETDGFDPDADDEGNVPGYNYDTDGHDPAGEDAGYVPEGNYDNDGIDPYAND